MRDTGVGIEPERLDQLFTEFSKVMRYRNLNKEGVGLGLVISKNLAEALGGEVKVKSKVNEGSTFQVYIPYHRRIAQRIASRHNLDSNIIRPVTSINMLTRDYVMSSITDEMEEEDQRIQQFGKISEMRFETVNMMQKSDNINDDK